MGCDCGCNDCGGLSGLYGLNGLMGQLLTAGSAMRVGVAYNFDWSSTGVEAERQGPNWLRSAILTQLQSLGIFSAINVAVQPPGYLGFVDGYITVQLSLSEDQSAPQNVTDMVHYAIATYAPGIVINRIEHAIDQVGAGSVAQVTPQQTPQTNTNPPPPGACQWETMKFGDWVACQLGIKDAIGGVAAGATGALIGVGVITLLAVVVLKK